MKCSICGFRFVEGERLVWWYNTEEDTYQAVHEACSLREDYEDLLLVKRKVEDDLDSYRAQVRNFVNRTQEQAREIKELKEELEKERTVFL